MRFELLQISLMALVGFTAAAPVATSPDVLEKRLLPAYPYTAENRIPIPSNWNRAIPPPYEELYRSIAKTE
ncbi:hypothetical protein F5Y12DRAFT_763096 [Xylaria sp. FL1777]|nr:hypothetical protein F5Y12DRAFT_763096 [Xylaria sp. FL1777]